MLTDMLADMLTDRLVDMLTEMITDMLLTDMLLASMLTNMLADMLADTCLTDAELSEQLQLTRKKNCRDESNLNVQTDRKTDQCEFTPIRGTRRSITSVLESMMNVF
jgi:hypothetical protein